MKTCSYMLLLAALSLGACSKSGSDSSFTGFVDAEYVYVAAPSAGWLRKAEVHVGDKVGANQELFSLDTEQQDLEVTQAQQQLEQAQAQALDLVTGARREEIEALESQLQGARADEKLAASEMQRWTNLVKKGLAPNSRGDQAVAAWQAASAKVDTLQADIRVAELGARSETQKAAAARVDAAETALKLAKWKLDQRRAASQRSGRVEEEFHFPGEFIAAGSPVYSILPDDALKVRFYVPENTLSALHQGQKVSLRWSGDDSARTAKINFIASDAEFTPPVIFSNKARQKLVYLVEARLEPGSGLRPGQAVDVSLND